ncbi:uncharacterized protein LOC123316948 [Coccinella septempunctata]|uniref:uncharacterized protein LOC123316948 n=1 Tax=Coccinella septempunctata TaxID=41139 RepID=UPI001D090382|nr:uncharacterized protein LOC123316948 [Coccinella septempunctata]
MADDTERLINLVKERVLLYDPRHTAYKNVSKKTEAWEEIAHELCQNSETVKVKWKNLRDSYVKYLKYLRGDSGSKKKFRNWPWASHMEFLQESLYLKTAQWQELHFFEEVITEGNYEAEVYASDDSQMPLPRKKLKTQRDSSSVENLIGNYPNETENIHKNLDRNDLLFLGYAGTFKKLSPQKQTVIKMKMALLFGQAELDELGLQISPSSFLFSLNCPSCKRDSLDIKNASEEMNRDSADQSNSESPVQQTSSNWFDEVKEEI